MIRRFIVLYCLFYLFGCHSSGRETYKKQGNKLSYEIAMQLKEIQSKEDLIKRSTEIKKKVEKLTKLMIEAHEKHDTDTRHNKEPISTEASDRLLYEIQRLCQIDGVQEIIEKIQRDALDKLDEYDQESKIKKYRG